jgi:hypothetical protein
MRKLLPPLPLITVMAAIVIAIGGAGRAAVPSASASSPNASPLGFALVDTGGDVLEAKSKNVTDANVSKPAGTFGVYCFRNLPFTARNISVTLGPTIGAGSGPVNPVPVAAGGFTPCPNPSDFLVAMQDPASTGWGGRDHSFYVTFN